MWSITAKKKGGSILDFRKGMKRAYVASYVTAAVFLTSGVSAFATTVIGNVNGVNDPTGLSSLGGSKTGSGINQFGSTLGTLIKSLIGIVGGVAVAYTLYEIYHTAILFMRGGTNAQRRDEAKTHLLHVVIGASITGASGIILAILLGLFSNLTSGAAGSTQGALSTVLLSTLVQ